MLGLAVHIDNTPSHWFCGFFFLINCDFASLFTFLLSAGFITQCIFPPSQNILFIQVPQIEAYPCIFIDIFSLITPCSAITGQGHAPWWANRRVSWEIPTRILGDQKPDLLNQWIRECLFRVWRYTYFKSYGIWVCLCSVPLSFQIWICNKERERERARERERERLLVSHS
jgi:hypothetical protein